MAVERNSAVAAAPTETLPAVDTEQVIRERAYYLWFEAGRPDGLADEYWKAAEDMIQRSASSHYPRVWPTFSADIVKDENRKLMIDRGDILVKSQEDGMRAMESRTSSLFGVTVTLLTASVAATATAIGSGTPSPNWVQPWTVPALCALVGFWLAATGVGGFAIIGTSLATQGVFPSDLYQADILSRNVNRLRMTICRNLQKVIDVNVLVTARYAKHLSRMVLLLFLGPATAIIVVLWLSRERWVPIVAPLESVRRLYEGLQSFLAF